MLLRKEKHRGLGQAIHSDLVAWKGIHGSAARKHILTGYKLSGKQILLRVSAFIEDW